MIQYDGIVRYKLNLKGNDDVCDIPICINNIVGLYIIYHNIGNDKISKSKFKMNKVFRLNVNNISSGL